MEKVLSLDSSKSHYRADACIVWCFDDRFSNLLNTFIGQQGFKHTDRVIVAGGAKSLALPDGPEKDFILNQIQLSAKLHGTSRVVLMLHSDCGGYGGLAAFADHKEERAHHVEELEKAADTVRRLFPTLVVESCIADFDGLYRV